MPVDFVVYGEGLCYASVCSSLGQEETEEQMRSRRCETTNGWTLSDEDFSDGTKNPSPCNLHPETHKHYLFVA